MFVHVLATHDTSCKWLRLLSWLQSVAELSQQLAVGTLDDLWQLVSFMVEQRLRGELHNYRIQNVNCQLRFKRNLSFPHKLSHRTIEGTGWYSCLMNCGKDRKVKGSITNDVTGIFL